MGVADLFGQVVNGAGVDTESGVALQGLTTYFQHYPTVGGLIRWA
jgi:hypothetical protein